MTDDSEASPTSPAAWHDDPDDPSQLRYWNGTKWTDHRAPKLRQTATPPAAAWMPDPDNPSVFRYWDGTNWTDHRAAPAQTGAPSSTTDWPPVRIVAALAGVAAIVGSIGPWATASTVFGSISVSGTDGDGVISLIAGAIALLTVITRTHALAIIGFLVVAGVGIYDIINVSDAISETSGEGFTASVGWGLWLVAIGGVAGLVSSLVDSRDSGPGG